MAYFQKFQAQRAQLEGSLQQLTSRWCASGLLLEQLYRHAMHSSRSKIHAGRSMQGTWRLKSSCRGLSVTLTH